MGKYVAYDSTSLSKEWQNIIRIRVLVDIRKAFKENDKSCDQGREGSACPLYV